MASSTPIQHASVRWTITAPKIPTEVTVIRRRRTMPDSWFAENIASAVGIPSGVLKHDPMPRSLSMSWTDTDGYLWTYDAEYGRVFFVLQSQPTVKTVSVLPADADLERSAGDFLKSRGVNMTLWGDAIPEFSWNEWWKNEQAAGRCMTTKTISQMRALQTADGSSIPQTSDMKLSTCTQTEFPAEETIAFSLSQDEQAIYDRDGSSAVAGRVSVRTDTLSAVRGWFELPKDGDRSNYPSINPDTLIQEIRVGGLRGSSGVENATDINIESFTQGLYRDDVPLNGETRTFFIPAIRMTGTATLSDGSHVPYASMIPLVRGDQYRGNE